MNHQVGDIITVTDYDTIFNRTTSYIGDLRKFTAKSSAYFTPEMKRYCNQTFTVKEVNMYGYELIGTGYTFSDYMLTSFKTVDVTQPYEYW